MTRIGAIRYLNARPLIAGLEQDPEVHEVRYEVPSLLARDLRAGALDLALVPQVEATCDAAYRIVPRLCIAADGPVESILLFLRRDWREVRRAGVDASSRASVELLKVLLHRRGGPFELVTMPPRLAPLHRDDCDLDALLLIGDRALAEDRGEFPRLDLGALWKEETGLPFVYALWVGRAETDPRAVAAVARAAARGLADRQRLAADFSREFPEVIDEARALRYITDVIRYTLGPAEEEALRVFHRLRVEAGFAPHAPFAPHWFESAR